MWGGLVQPVSQFRSRVLTAAAQRSPCADTSLVSAEQASVVEQMVEQLVVAGRYGSLVEVMNRTEAKASVSGGQLPAGRLNGQGGHGGWCVVRCATIS